jgi:hypothetical protein
MIKFFGAILSLALIFLVIAIITAVPLMLLWNWLMPELFHLPTISILQAFGLSILSSILFKSSSSSSSSNTSISKK